MPYKPVKPSFIQFFAGLAGFLAAIVILPVFLVVKLVMMPFEKPLKRAPEEVVCYLRRFVEGTDGPWDWDNFTTQPIADIRLDNIRDRLAALEVPLSDADQASLQELFAEAEAIAASDRYTSMQQ